MRAPVAHDGYGKVARKLLSHVIVAIAVLLAGVLACFSFSALTCDWEHKGDRARLDLKNVHNALLVARVRSGVWPTGTHWATDLVDAGILEREPLDPWDRPYLVGSQPTDGGAPWVSSVGPDGEPNTGDDVW
jgi:hypothetical protein